MNVVAQVARGPGGQGAQLFAKFWLPDLKSEQGGAPSTQKREPMRLNHYRTYTELISLVPTLVLMGHLLRRSLRAIKGHLRSPRLKMASRPPVSYIFGMLMTGGMQW